MYIHLYGLINTHRERKRVRERVKSDVRNVLVSINEITNVSHAFDFNEVVVRQRMDNINKSCVKFLIKIVWIIYSGKLPPATNSRSIPFRRGSCNFNFLVVLWIFYFKYIYLCFILHTHGTINTDRSNKFIQIVYLLKWNDAMWFIRQYYSLA